MRQFQVECWDGEGRHWFRKFSSYDQADVYRWRMLDNGFTAWITEVAV